MRPREPAPAPVLPLEQAWAVTLPAAPAAGGALDDLAAYVPLSDERLIAIDRESGETRWTADIESAWPPVVRDGVVYLAASDELHALDAATGVRKWRVPVTRAVIAPMIIVGDLLIVVVSPDELWGVRLETGERAWRRELGGKSGASGLAADDRWIYAAMAGGHVASVSAADGTVRWSRILPGDVTPPARARDRVFVGTTDDRFYALDAEDGDIAWSWSAGGDVVGAAADGDLVFYASLDNILRAVNRSNGNQRWKQALSTRPSQPPIAFGGTVIVVGLAPALASFAGKAGTPIAMLEVQGELQGAPLIDTRLPPFRVSVIVVTRDGQAMGLRPVAMMFHEQPIAPLTALPGKPLARERLPN